MLLPSVMYVYCIHVVTRWERADLLALLCLMFNCILSISHMVSWVMIFAFSLTLLPLTYFLSISCVCKYSHCINMQVAPLYM